MTGSELKGNEAGQGSTASIYPKASRDWQVLLGRLECSQYLEELMGEDKSNCQKASNSPSKRTMLMKAAFPPSSSHLHVKNIYIFRAGTAVQHANLLSVALASCVSTG